MRADTRTFLRIYFAVGFELSLLAVYQAEQQTHALLDIAGSHPRVVMLVLFCLNAVGGLVLLLRPQEFVSFWQGFVSDHAKAGWKLLGALFLVVPFPLLWLARFGIFAQDVPGFLPLFWVFWCVALLQASGLRMLIGTSWEKAFAIALMLDGLVFQTYVIFQPVSSYPFSLGWSEASRYYYGSLLFSRSLYGHQLPLSAWHATRYFLLALPFLIRGLPLWADRLWQSLLWFGLTGLTAWSLSWRLRPTDKGLRYFLLSWSFLYYFQGAVYYHLLVSVIVVLIGFSVRHPWRSLIAVILASFWAGMSRINWYPVPALLAGALYLLEEPLSHYRSPLSYAAKPFLWGAIGLASAVSGQVFYYFISGNHDLSAYTSSLHSSLLFSRWLPNDTNPLGILPGILLVTLPLLILLYWSVGGHLSNLHPLRRWGLVAILLPLFMGGLIVSSKIGGGGDLHNMDAFMLILAVMAAYVVARRVGYEASSSSPFRTASWPAMILLLIVPVGFSLSRVVPPVQYDALQASADLATLRRTVHSYSKSGQVLFIYERHLLTFGMIPNVPVVQDYEVLTLMEMAISDNQPYLNRFHQDLHAHRFAAIVATKQNLDSKSVDFAEESAVWNRLVAYPLLCEYVPVLTLQSSNIQVYIPRPSPACPPFVDAPSRP